MYCQNCQKEFPDVYRFCSDCGKPLVKRNYGTLWVPALVLAAIFAVGMLVWLFV